MKDCVNIVLAMGDTVPNMKNKSEDYWKQVLSPDQYKVLRQKSTERAFTGDLLYNKEDGVYTCGACGAKIFDSDKKFDSGSGWPSFYDVADSANVEFHKQQFYGITATEVVCGNCGGHLGHVFDDGPEPTGKRFCINSCALDFEKKQ